MFKIQHYNITSILGQGGMATVHLAYDNKFDSNVAIKLLNKEFTHNENIRKRFLAEAKSMYRMSHPNIIKVTDLIDDNDTVAFVMEHVEGETLKEFIDRKGKLIDDEIKSIFSQMLDAVGYVHGQNLVHRDIKPSNFMIDDNGNVKLMDFGIAKNMDENSAEYTHTVTGAQMGTPMYMSPEQITDSKSVTPQSDIYSLGVVLWQMVTGEKPYNTKTLSNFQLQMKIVQETLPKTNTRWDDIIIKATQKEIENRFSSSNSFKNYLILDSHQENLLFKSMDQLDKTVINSISHVINKMIKCPRCLGKGHVDWNDIYRLNRQDYWSPGECALCENKGEIPENKINLIDDVNLTIDNLSKPLKEKKINNIPESIKEFDNIDYDNKTFIDEFYPDKVHDFLKKIFYEVGLDSFGYIMDNKTMENSIEYDVFWTVEQIDVSDTAIIYFSFNNITFLVGSYNSKWVVVFNGQKYFELDELSYLNNLNLDLPRNSLNLIIEYFNRFKGNGLYFKLNEYKQYIVDFYRKKIDEIINVEHNDDDLFGDHDFQERMMEEVKNLSQVFSNLDTKSYYCNEIPQKKINNFWSRFKNFNLDINTSFYWYYDDTIFGKGDDGIAIVKTSEDQWLLLIAEFSGLVEVIELVSSSELFSGEFNNYYKLHSINGDSQRNKFDEIGTEFINSLTLIVVDEDNELKRLDFSGFTNREKINALCDFWISMEFDAL
jgi:serine/threonine protein kinase